MKVQYFIKKRKNPYTKIYMRFWESQKYDFTTSTGLTVNYNFWDFKNQKVKNKIDAIDKDFINSKLLELQKNVIENFNLNYNSENTIGKDWLKNRVDIFFNRVDETKPELTYFVDWIKKFVENAPKRLHKGKNISETTIKKYNTVLNNIIKYENAKNQRLRFEDITLNFYFDFIDFCTSTQKLGINTIGTRIKTIKLFCRQIDLEGLPISQHYKNPEFVAREQKAHDIYLTTAEIEKIFNFDFAETPYLDNARDLLIIGLNTGLRISDFMRLDLSHIKDDTIRIKAQKTGKIAEIPINTQIETTLNKRGGNLPHAISEQKFNEYIKEIGKKVGFTEIVQGAKIQCIDEVNKTFRKVTGNYPKYEIITSHICRRSFATNLYGKIPTPVIMTITGHSTETQFLTYIKKTNAENAEILRNFYKRNAKENGLTSILKVV